jgi:hypothetical protein
MTKTRQKKFLVLLHIKTISLADKKPMFTVTLNNKIQLSNKVVSDTVVYEMFTHIGNSQLRIQLLNKDNSDTKVDINNNVVEDLAIQVVKFEVEGIDQIPHYYDHVVYNTNNGTSEKTYGFMHTNGELIFDFVCPTFYNMRNTRLIDKNVPSTTNQITISS